jgi:hypothetical protein
MRALFAAILLVPAPVFAADCTLATALYADRASGYEIRFEPRGQDSALSETNNFELHLPDGPVLEGKVEWSNGASRPIGILGVRCDNDTGFCKYWEGLVYELRSGRIELVSAEDAEPPEQILFTDLGASLFYSNLTLSYDMQSAPNDAFDFVGCAG